ncbi:MAG: hypothetical protein RML95_08120 [Anaerolineae bacterium]|nr:hypothetical protein [Anaerolineae bacterium]MDW8299291.1 hypothetical protein [Anaerolineae bacterium]
MLFAYHTERVSLLMFFAALSTALFGILLGNVLGVAIAGSGTGILCWSGLQVLRQGRGIRLYDDYLLVQGSVTGRVRRIPYANVLGFATTQRGGFALLYCELPSAPQPTLPPEALIGIAGRENEQLRQRFVLTARLAQPQMLHTALTERLPHALSVPETYIIGLARRRRLRDALIVLVALIATPLYVLILSRLLSSLI